MTIQRILIIPLMIIVIGSMLFTCQSKLGNPANTSLKVIDTIRFPLELLHQKSLHDKFTTLDHVLKNNYVLIYFFNTDCSKCISTLYRWQQFIANNKKSDWELNYVFIGYGISPHFIDYVIDEKISFKYPIFFVHTKNPIVQSKGILFPYLDASIIVRNKYDIIYKGDFLNDFAK